jgi:hypothetical protein
MKKLSETMLGFMERLAEMFPDNAYQTRLESYLSTKSITDAAQLENYMREYHFSHKE